MIPLRLCFLLMLIGRTGQVGQSLPTAVRSQGLYQILTVPVRLLSPEGERGGQSTGECGKISEVPPTLIIYIFHFNNFLIIYFRCLYLCSHCLLAQPDTTWWAAPSGQWSGRLSDTDCPGLTWGLGAIWWGEECGDRGLQLHSACSAPRYQRLRW